MKKADDTNKKKTGIAGAIHKIKKNWQLHLLIAVPVIYSLIFYYQPMYGAQIAFRDYRARLGILGSKWVGLKWFEKFFTSYQFKTIFTNTLVLSLYSIIVGFLLSVTIALILNSLRNEKLKKVTQTVTYIPHFISVVVIVAIVNQVFSPLNGLYGTLFRLFGGTGYPEDFRAKASAFRHLYVWSEVWQNLGWDTIIYMAALSAVSPDLHEAAMIDGATRWKRIIHVDFPTVLPTACLMLILRCGSMMSIGFEKDYLMQTKLNLTTSEIIPTYVYKVALGSSSDFSYGAAIGLFNSVINCVIVILANYFVRKASNDEIRMF